MNSDLNLSLVLWLFACQRQDVLPRCTESPRPLNIKVNKMRALFLGHSLYVNDAVTCCLCPEGSAVPG